MRCSDLANGETDGMSSTDMEKLVNEAGSGRIFDDARDFIDFAARYHGDESFRNAVIADPAAALRSEGVAVPDGVAVRLLSSDTGVLHVVLPPRTDPQEPADGFGNR